jgi:ATP-dependent exoDNAse (exonuclease V) beta subunit
MKNFIVYKSSAGSGKTFTLVKEYLKMVLVNPSLVRNVLAITFTNKAANEMKHRIITSLKEMKDWEQFEDSNTVKFLLPVVLEETGLSKEEIKNNSHKVLTYILHNYSDFGVSTIDSFVHKIIRSFAFDLHLPLNFEVELQTNELLVKVIDILLSKVGTDENLTNLLVNFVQTKADDEKNWNIERDLFNASRSLMKEDAQMYIEKLEKLQLPDFVEINKEMIKQIQGLEKSLWDHGAEVMQVIESSGIPPEAFFQGNRGVVAYFNRFADRNFEKILPNSYTLKTIEEDKWTSTKANMQDINDIEEIRPVIEKAYEKVSALINDDYKNYCTYNEIVKHLYPVAILSTLEKLISEYKTENNLVLISEFNKRIAEVVLSEPIPFVYERVGEKYHHFLVDEFQDTSILQWQNLLPLLENSLANANKNLIVGDGKQAIYRWRSGEVEQFARLPKIFNKADNPDAIIREKALEANYVEKVLNSNFRSKPEIIKFNNDFFEFIKTYLSDDFQPIYEGVKQQFNQGSKGGYVKIEFFKKDVEAESFSEFNIQRIREIINNVLENGYQYEDIAILCRSNANASAIAASLLKENIQVISSESLLINNSPEVRFMIAWLKLLLDVNDRIAKTEVVKWMIDAGMIADKLDEQLSAFQIGKRNKSSKTTESFFSALKDSGFDINIYYLNSLPVYEICEELIRIFNLNPQCDPYIQFFLDVILEQSAKPDFDIAELLALWEQKKNTFSIVVPEGINAVKVMTIHKSKGLEFPVVIYPFANDKHNTSGEQLWVDFHDDKFKTLQSMLITTSAKLEETHFKSEYDTEKNKSLLDLLNILYVVMTRPTDQLYILSAEAPTGKSLAVSVPVLIQQYLKNKELWLETGSVYEFGENTPKEYSENPPAGSYQLNEFISNSWRERILLSLQAPEFWETEAPVAKQETGNLIHKIFSEIITVEQFEGVVDKYFNEGIIDTKQTHQIKQEIKNIFTNPEIRKLFQPCNQVKTEAEIILPDGNTFRPDRINIHTDKTEIIDFKTGKETPKHKRQLKTYMRILEEMKYTNVKGYIIYVSPSKVVEVS